MSPAEFHGVVERVRGEFMEMPGLRLTVSQAARLWSLDAPICRHVIDTLVKLDFLRWTTTGTIARIEP